MVPVERERCVLEATRPVTEGRRVYGQQHRIAADDGEIIGPPPPPKHPPMAGLVGPGGPSCRVMFGRLRPPTAGGKYGLTRTAR